MKQIPLTKKAGILDSIEDAVWDSSAGPLENLLRLAENLGIIFSGGTIGIALTVAEAAGWDLGRLGKHLDEQFSLHSISDLAGVNSEKLAQSGAEAIGGDAQPDAEDAAGDFGSPLGASGSVALSLRKNALDLGFYGQTRGKFRGLGNFTQSSKKGKLFSGLLKLFGFLFGWLKTPTSVLSKALRAAGIVGAVAAHKQFESGGRQKSEPSRPTINSPKVQLERAVDQILGAE
jgi:hypothetical protein